MELRLNSKPASSDTPALPETILSVSGRFIRKAVIKDEEWLADDTYGCPTDIVLALKDAAVRIDIFSFSQKLPDIKPKYPFPYEWDNVAAIDTAHFDQWWSRIPQEARKNYRRAIRRGVVVREFKLNDDLLRGIVSIYNETPMRQGRRFTHYGKDFATVKREASTFSERCVFIGAFYDTELIGFIKLIRSGSIGSIMHVVSKNRHYDKRPSNALITKAAEYCRDNGISFLVYGRYTYGNKINNPLTEFKRRLGFEKVLVPVYYVALSNLGRIFHRSKLHRGLIGILPPVVIKVLLRLRSVVLQGVCLIPKNRNFSSEGLVNQMQKGADQ